jgi:hypothetical protein
MDAPADGEWGWRSVEFVCITFDGEGGVSERAVRHGNFRSVARDVHAASIGQARGYELVAALICRSDLDPGEMQDALHSALLLKLSPETGMWLPPAHRAAWCRETKSVRK